MQVLPWVLAVVALFAGAYLLFRYMVIRAFRYRLTCYLAQRDRVNLEVAMQMVDTGQYALSENEEEMLIGRVMNEICRILSTSRD